MKTVTFDTNLIDDQNLINAARAANFLVAHTTVTDRELSGSGIRVAEGRQAELIETAVIGESAIGRCLIGSDDDARNFERVLEVISSGSFPARGKLNNLTAGQRRQTRDAMIFCTHVREKRDLFITDDLRGFIKNGHREALENEFDTKIHTRDEFLNLCNGRHSNLKG